MKKIGRFFFAALTVLTIFSCKTEKDYLIDLSDSDASVRLKAVKGLSKTESSIGRGGLIRGLNDSDGHVRLAAVHSLKTVLDRAADARFFEELKEPFMALIRFEQDNQIRVEVIRTLEKYADQRILGQLADNLLRENCQAVCWETLLLLGKRKFQPGVSVAMDVLVSSPDPEIKKAAIWALGEIGDRRAFRMLEDLSQNRRWVELWPSCQEALGKLQPGG